MAEEGTSQPWAKLLSAAKASHATLGMEPECLFHVGHSPRTPLYPCARSQLGRRQISSGPRSSTPLLSTPLRNGLGRHLDGIVGDLGLVLNSEEMALDFFKIAAS